MANGKDQPKRAGGRRARELTPKQARFAIEYLVDLNATQAAIRAGYAKANADVVGSQLLGKTWVAEEIQRQQAARAARTEVTIDRVVLELARIAFNDARAYFGDRHDLKAIGDLGEDQGAALAGVEVDAIFEGRGDERVLIGYTRKVKFWPKVPALKLLGRHLGAFKDAKQPAGPITIRVVREDAASSAADDDDDR
jgi:phage terminase small subunit